MKPQRTVFGSVDEAYNYMVTPEILESLHAITKAPHEKLQKEGLKILAFIEDGSLRKALEKMYAEKGKIEFGYSQEAWSYLREMK